MKKMILISIIFTIMVSCNSLKLDDDEFVKDPVTFNIKQTVHTEQKRVFNIREKIKELLQSGKNVNVIFLDLNDNSFFDAMASDYLEHFGNYDNFRVINRTVSKHIESELLLQLSGNIKETDIIQLGNQIGANYIITKNTSELYYDNKNLCQATQILSLINIEKNTYDAIDEIKMVFKFTFINGKREITELVSYSLNGRILVIDPKDNEMYYLQ